MEIINLYELQTQGKVATKAEITTVTVNLIRGLRLREIKVAEDKIHFLFEENKNCPKTEEENKFLREVKEENKWMREAMEQVYHIGYNKDCIFCGLKDKKIKEALEGFGI